MCIRDSPKTAHVSVVEKDTGRSVICNVEGYPYVLIWSAAKKPLHFICIEPWHSLPGEENGPLEWEQRPCAASLKKGESWSTTLSVSYTHLDVYKRQSMRCICKGTAPRASPIF